MTLRLLVGHPVELPQQRGALFFEKHGQTGQLVTGTFECNRHPLPPEGPKSVPIPPVDPAWVSSTPPMMEQ